jgi:hypothetical protein
MGQSRPRESSRRRRRRAGRAGLKSGKGRGEARTSFQGKVRAFSLADRLGELGKRLQQRLRLLALGARHLADSAAPRGVPLRTGSRPPFAMTTRCRNARARVGCRSSRPTDRPEKNPPEQLPRGDRSARHIAGRGAMGWFTEDRAQKQERVERFQQEAHGTYQHHHPQQWRGPAAPPPPAPPKPPPERPLRLPRHHHGNITRPFRRPRLRPPRPAHSRPPPVSRPRARASRLRPNPNPRRPTPSSPTVGTTARR